MVCQLIVHNSKTEELGIILPKKLHRENSKIHIACLNIVSLLLYQMSSLKYLDYGLF
jgi:hypothetical protein